ncbi:MAG TPA: glycosyltransferase family 2 protein [Bryobacteraceae bacterium]|nr:glycosyltransferase family 2 protein [Bryobacteraceae bacterium]
MQNSPYFSIVIPVYNREREVARALASCFRQSFQNFEVLVIDDASADRTRDVVERVGGRRATLLRHERNLGVCAARNTGVRAARGEWILFLDSDDEYTETALQTIFDRTHDFGDEVERIGFMYRLDTGGLSPFPRPEGELLDYEGYLRWSEQATLSDFHNCIRRRTFQQVMLPEDRVYEDIYHLDFAKAFRTRLLADVVAVVHSDALNRCANLPVQTRGARVLAEAAAGASGIDQLLAAHGTALSEFAPRRFETYRRMRVAYHLLAGEKGRGLGLAIRHLARFPRSHLSWMIPAIGLFGPAALAKAYARRKHAVSQRVRP